MKSEIKLTSNFYEILVNDVPVYIGYTNRTIEERFKEHLRDKNFQGEAVVKSLGSLSFDFTWDLEKISEYAEIVSQKETDLIIKNGTSHSPYQKGTIDKIGGSTWTYIKWFVKTNRQNPKFKNLTEAEILDWLEKLRIDTNCLYTFIQSMRHPDEIYLKSFISNMNDPDKIYLSGFVRHMMNPDKTCLKKFIADMINPDKLYLKSFVHHMNDPDKEYLKNFVADMINPDKLYLKSFVRHMANPDKLYLKDFISGMVNPDKLYLKSFTSMMINPDSAYLKSFVHHMNDPDKEYLKSFVDNMINPDKMYLINFVKNMKIQQYLFL